MLFKVHNDVLVKFFKLASFVTSEKKPANSIVGSHVLLQVKDQFITMIATDLDVELVVKEEISSQQIITPGSLVVPFRRINEICRAVNENILLQITSVENENLKIKIELKKSFFIINYLAAEIFPIIDAKNFTKRFNLKAKLLQDLLSKVSFAMGDQEGRHFLNGVHLHFSPDKISSIAADGHRLMIWELAQEFIPEEIKNLNNEILIIIPRKSVFDILKILADYSQELLVNIEIGNNHIRINFSNVTYTSKLLNTISPPYRKLIPITNNLLTIAREGLKNACLRVSALFEDRSQAIKLKFTSDLLVIIGVNNQGDLAEENLPAVLQGKELEMVFNLKYLLDFLYNSHAEQIVFKFENAVQGIVIQDLGSDSIYVLMPMRI